MKIAIIAPVMVEVPPKTYGGTQLMIYELAMGLAERGHRLTVFCSAGSELDHKNIEVVESAPYPMIDHPEQNRYWEARQILDVLARQGEFDVIHFFYEPIVCGFEIEGREINFMRLFNKPVVSSFRNLTNIKSHIDYYKKNSNGLKHILKIFLSKRQRSHLEFLKNSQVIYNGIDAGRYEFAGDKDDYLLFLGRITREKGILEAVEAAKKTKSKLLIAAKICKDDMSFYGNEVKKHIDGDLIRYVGEVGFAEKVKYLSKAKALFFPISWDEPFGIVVAEALTCGTPVIAFDKGAMREIIKDGHTGFIVRNVRQIAGKIGELGRIKPENCRRSIERGFSNGKMVDEHENAYLKVLKNC